MVSRGTDSQVHATLIYQNSKLYKKSDLQDHFGKRVFQNKEPPLNVLPLSCMSRQNYHLLPHQ